MVHVKQGVRGELTNKLGFQYWKGRKCEKDYWEQPWEKEAPSRQTGSIRMGEHSMTVTELEVEIAWAFETSLRLVTK